MKKKVTILGTFISICLIVLSLAHIQSKSGTELKESKKEIFYETYNYLSKDIEVSSGSVVPSASFVNNNTPEDMLNRADAVAIVSIISVDGINNTINPAVGATYGKLVVNNVLYGDLKEKDTIEYIKSGAIMSLDDWEKSQPEDARAKREEIRKEAGIDDTYLKTTYKAFHYANDPIVEDGKTYLAYLKYNSSVEKYEIMGRENGFRELNIAKQERVSAKDYNTKEFSIKNNISNEFEALDSYIKTNIKTNK